MGEPENGDENGIDPTPFRRISDLIQQMMAPLEALSAHMTGIVQLQEQIGAIGQRWQEVFQVVEANQVALRRVDLITDNVRRTEQAFENMGQRLALIQPAIPPGETQKLREDLVLLAAREKRNQLGYIRELKEKLKEKEEENEDLKKQLEIALTRLSAIEEDIKRSADYRI
jgi:hypothetical protein